MCIRVTGCGTTAIGLGELDIVLAFNIEILYLPTALFFLCRSCAHHVILQPDFLAISHFLSLSFSLSLSLFLSRPRFCSLLRGGARSLGASVSRLDRCPLYFMPLLALLPTRLAVWLGLSAVHYPVLNLPAYTERPTEAETEKGANTDRKIEAENGTHTETETETERGQ